MLVTVEPPNTAKLDAAPSGGGAPPSVISPPPADEDEDAEPTPPLPPLPTEEAFALLAAAREDDTLMVPLALDADVPARPPCPDSLSRVPKESRLHAVRSRVAIETATRSVEERNGSICVSFGGCDPRTLGSLLRDLFSSHRMLTLRRMNGR
jgi:hypothetical protein